MFDFRFLIYYTQIKNAIIYRYVERGWFVKGILQFKGRKLY